MTDREFEAKAHKFDRKLANDHSPVIKSKDAFRRWLSKHL